jgi:apolipoprotein D and lipocalin family protein
VAGFEARRYEGLWYEIMRLDHRFERGLTNVTATYDIRDDGTVGVLNRGFDRTDCSWREVDGTATFQGAPTVASLSVTFFWPFAGGYHVFALDRQNYDYAMVSGPTTGYLWILARRPKLPAGVRSNLIANARARGFPVEDLIPVDHSDPTCRQGR